MRGGWSAAFAAAFLLVFACAPPKNIAVVVSPTPSPSPTPTAPLQASSPAFHIGEVGVGYSPVALSATGGVAPYTWTVGAGALPGDLTLGGNGTVSGNPTSAGDFSFTIQVADAGGGTAMVDGKIGVAAALSASLIPACAKYCNVELGCVDVCGAFGQQTGGVAPYSYSLVQGPLPSGTALAGLSLTGKFGGLSGYLKFTVSITDALGAGTTIAPTFWMYPHISFDGGTIPVSQQNLCYWTGAPSSTGCTAQFRYSGGTPNAGIARSTATWVSYTCAVSPTMPTITVSGSLVTIAVPGGGTRCNGWSGTLSVVLTNQDVCASGPTYCSSSALIKITQQAS